MLIGLVGKANTGKSTFFKSSTLAEVEIANYPFTTIKPNSGIAYIKVDCPEKEFNLKCNPRFGFCINSKRFIPIQLLDVAGLVPDAHLGKGLGNEFLNDLIPADALILVIDISGSTNEKGVQVKQSSYDPSNDIKFLEKELDMWFFQIIKKGWEKFSRTAQMEKLPLEKSLAKQLTGLKVDEDIIKSTIKEFSTQITKWTDEEILKLASTIRKKSKPLVIAANKSDLENSEKNLEKIKKEFQDYKIIPCSAEFELMLRLAAKNSLINYIPGENNFKIISKLNESQLNALKSVESFLNKFGSTGVQDVLNYAVFQILNCITAYPVENENKFIDKSNNILPDAFLMPNNSTALDLAYAIHTDIGKKFKGAVDCRTKKRLGKDYKLKNNDVIKILT